MLNSPGNARRDRILDLSNSKNSQKCNSMRGYKHRKQGTSFSNAAYHHTILKGLPNLGHSDYQTLYKLHNYADSVSLSFNWPGKDTEEHNCHLPPLANSLRRWKARSFFIKLLKPLHT